MRFFTYFTFISLLLGLYLVTESCADDPYYEGRQLYNAYCGDCHMDDGGGLRQLIPPLTDLEYLQKRKDLIPCSIKYGVDGKMLIDGREFNEAMPGTGNLTAPQITEILNYVFKEFNNSKFEISSEEVRHALTNCK